MDFTNSNFQATTKINLSNLKRCDQIWDDMPLCEQGRLCQKCDHVIIDFRDKSDYEVAKIHTFTEGKVCGMYTKKQLKPPVKRKPNDRLVKWQSIYIGLLGLLYSNPLTSQVQNDTIKIVQVESVNKEDSNSLEQINAQQKEAVRDSIIIFGQVRDWSGEALLGTSVLLVNTTIGTVTDLEGRYFLNVTEVFEKETEIALEFSYVGFATQRIEGISQDNIARANGVIDVILEEGFAYSYGVARLPWYRRAWNKVKIFFRRKH